MSKYEYQSIFWPLRCQVRWAAEIGCEYVTYKVYHGIAQFTVWLDYDFPVLEPNKTEPHIFIGKL